MSSHRSSSEMILFPAAEPSATKQVDFSNLQLPRMSSEHVGAVAFMAHSRAGGKGCTSGTEPMIVSENANDAQSAGSHRNACRLTVERQAPFIVKHADENWLLMFGFNRGEITGRALRVCQGPDTVAQHMSDIIANGGTLESHTLYSKCGDEKKVRIVASAVEGSDGADECLLQMFDCDAPSQLPDEENERPQAILSASAPFLVESVNVAFLSFFGFTMPQVTAQGVGIVFNSKTDKYKWRWLLQAGVAGASTTVQLVTQTADQCEVSTAVAVAPLCDKQGVISRLTVTFDQGESSVHHSYAQANPPAPAVADGPVDGELSRLSSSSEDSGGSSTSMGSGGSPSSKPSDPVSRRGIDVIDNVRHHLDALKSMRNRAC